MGDVQRVVPKPGAYVNEWRTVKFEIGDWQSIKRLLRPLGRSVFVDLEPATGPVLVVVGHGVTLYAEEGAWIVLSPHGRVWVVPDGEIGGLFYFGGSEAY